MNGMRCSAVRDLLPERAHGKLDSVGTEAVDRHLSGCRSCTEELAFMGWLRAHAPTPPADLEARVCAAVADDRRSILLSKGSLADAAASRRFGFRAPSWAIAAAAVLALALGSTLMLRRNPALASEEEVVQAYFEGVPAVWGGPPVVVAGAPALDDLSHLSDDDLLRLLEAIGQ